jgi:hypothetical protein
MVNAPSPRRDGRNSPTEASSLAAIELLRTQLDRAEVHPTHAQMMRLAGIQRHLNRINRDAYRDIIAGIQARFDNLPRSPPSSPVSPNDASGKRRGRKSKTNRYRKSKKTKRRF